MKKFKYYNCRLDLRGVPKPIVEAMLIEHVSGLGGADDCEGLTRRGGSNRYSSDFGGPFTSELDEVSLTEFFELESHTIKIDGKTIELSEESYQELRKQLVGS